MSRDSAVGLLCTWLIIFSVLTTEIACKRDAISPNTQAAAKTKPSSAPASQPLIADSQPADDHVRLHLPADVPGPVRQAFEESAPGTVGQRLDHAWTSGGVAFAEQHPVFTIARDYDQELALPIKNAGGQTTAVLASLEPFGEGLLGDFVGSGGMRAIDVAPMQTATLALHLHAQDASRRSYRSLVMLRDAHSGQALAAAPLTVFIRQPSFSIEATIGPQELSTLARMITIKNNGEALTDFTARPAEGLAGKVLFQPAVEHVFIAPRGTLRFLARPVLEPGFSQTKGKLVMSAAGQQKTFDVAFSLPPGARVFVATSFSTTSNDAAGSYCTNNPNTNTPIGGPSSGDDEWEKTKQRWDNPDTYADGTPRHPPAGSGSGKDNEDDENPISKLANYLNSHVSARGIPGLPINTSGRGSVGVEIGPVKVSGDYGAAPGGDPHGPLVDSNYTVKVGPYTVANGHGTASISPGTQDTLNIDSPSTPTGSQLGHADGNSGNSGAQNGPRGLRVRDAYAKFRPSIYQDNQPEALRDIAPGDLGSRMILQVWHSDRWTNGKGRQILLRAWEGTARKPLTRAIAVSPADTFAQWPTVLSLPRGEALVVWETSPTGHGPPSLVYRLGGNGFGSWSKVTPIPGADGPAGNYDPQALLAPDGHVLLFWQQGRGADARVMQARSNDQGTFSSIVPMGLPVGASRPLPRLTVDGAICLVFQAPPATAEPGVEAAVYAATSRDSGANFTRVHRLSPAGIDAGEADLLISGTRVDVALRAGPTWQSRIEFVSSADGGQSWGESRPLTDESRYAEYPTLARRDTGTELSFYGGARSDRDLRRAGTTRPAAASGYATLKRFAITAGADGLWSSPLRVLTHFPAVQAAWLEVTFDLAFPRRDYSPHEIEVLFNGKSLLHQTHVIPEGTYLLPVGAGLLAQNTEGNAHNVIGLRTQHMSPGHYLTAAKFRLQARHAFMERLVAAENQEQADAMVAEETTGVNHARPDVGVFARLASTPPLIPATPTQGQTITLALMIANIGEHSAGGVKVRVFPGTPDGSGHFKVPAVGKEINLGTLAPFDLRDVDVSFPFGGAETYTVVAASDADAPAANASRDEKAVGGRDFDPNNNFFRVSFAAPRPPTITARESDRSGPIVADLDDNPEPPYGWRILDAQSGKEVASIAGGQLKPAGPIPPGQFKLALRRFQFEGEELIFPGVIEHKADEPIDATIRTSVELQLPAWAPPIWRWQLAAVDPPKKVVQWHAGEHRVMVIPPGDYRVSIRPSQFNSEWLVWPQVVHVDEGRHVIVKLDSGVEPPEGFVAAQPTPWRWMLWAEGKVPPDSAQPVQYVQGGWDAMLVPPGRYRWGVRSLQFGSKTVVFPQPVEVEAGKRVSPAAPGVVQIIPSRWSGMPYQYAALDIPNGGTIGEINQLINQLSRPLPMLLPPGDYKLLVRPLQFNCQDVELVSKVHVESGATVNVALDSGIDVQPPAGSTKEDPPYSLSFTLEGQAKPIQIWTQASWGPVVLPPGAYHVTLRPRQFNCVDLMWPRTVEVRPGELAQLTIDSGIRVNGIPTQPRREMNFRVLVAPPTTRAVTKPAAPPPVPEGREVQNGPLASLAKTQWLPPGIYTLQVQEQFAPWQTIKQGVTVEASRITPIEYVAPDEKSK